MPSVQHDGVHCSPRPQRGEEGEIKVEFNSAGKSAMQTKDITILANTNPVKTILQIKVFVEKKDN